MFPCETSLESFIATTVFSVVREHATKSRMEHIPLSWHKKRRMDVDDETDLVTAS